MKTSAEKKYGEIINLPHHEPTFQPRMPLINRAASFSPFAALTGHGDLINEAGRLTQNKLELSESAIEEINSKLKLAMTGDENRPEVTVIYFLPDEKKDGGAVFVHTGQIKKLDEQEQTITFNDGTKIPIDGIYDCTPATEMAAATELFSAKRSNDDEAEQLEIITPKD